MKLELKHLAGYLPYGLKAQDLRTKEVRIVTLLHFTYDNETVGHNHLIYEGLMLSKHLPILFPLSDLTKEIEVNGEKFVPMKKLARIMHPNEEFHFLETSFARNVQSVKYKYHVGRNTVCDTINIYTEELNQGSKYCFNIMNTDLWIAQKLYEWHFDIHNLIENNLAIDINTL